MKNKEKSLSKLFSGINEYYSPRVIGEVNDVYVKITKVKGHDVPWHTHDNEDEMFYMVKGSMIMEIKNEGSFDLSEGEYFIVGKGTEHRVYSEEECWIMLIEPKATKHTGSVQSGITRSIDEQLNN